MLLRLSLILVAPFVALVACVPVEEPAVLPALSRPTGTPAAGAPTSAQAAGCGQTPPGAGVEAERLLAPISTPAAPQPFQPAILRKDASLQTRLMTALGNDAEGYAFVVKDLRTGRGAAHNAEKVFY